VPYDRSDANIDTIRRVYDAFASRDTDVIQAVFADDSEIWQSPELPWGSFPPQLRARRRSWAQSEPIGVNIVSSTQEATVTNTFVETPAPAAVAVEAVSLFTG
jgi:ketosteroid isomerase-like protein